MQRTTTYREQSRVFLAQAHEELAKGDLQQASEKGWGAASQMVKAVAQERGWLHRSHRHLHGVINSLDRETGDPEWASILFGIAGENLHIKLLRELAFGQWGWIERRLQQVGRFVDKAEELLETTALDERVSPTPSPQRNVRNAENNHI